MTPKVEHIVAAGVKQATAQKWVEAVAAACQEFNITPRRGSLGSYLSAPMSLEALSAFRRT